MMKIFKGFSPGKTRTITLPAPFFSELLPLIDDVAELKVTLFCFRALQQKEGRYRYLRHADFNNDPDLARGLQAAQPEAELDSILDAALQRAVERETLLIAELKLDEQPERLYFMNTARGRSAIEQLRAGRWQPADGDNPIEILPERPNIFALYEANIGLLTPLIADALRDAEKDYPNQWIEEAITIATQNNKRNWKYIQAILKRWEASGKTDQKRDGQHYVSGKYADFIES